MLVPNAPMLTPQEEVALGQGAAALLVNPVFTQTLDLLLARYREMSRKTPAGSAGRDEREAIHAKTCALDDIQSELRIARDNGEIAKAQIAEEERRSKK